MIRPVTAVAAAVLSAAGCTHVASENDDPRIGGVVPLEAVSGIQPAGVAPIDKTRGDGPSISGLSREHWPSESWPVPRGEVVHQPTYRSEPWVEPYGQMELTPEGVMAGPDLDASARTQRLSAVLEPVQSFVDAVLLIPRAIITPPTTPVRGPVDRPVRQAAPSGGAVSPPGASGPEVPQ